MRSYLTLALAVIILACSPAWAEETTVTTSEQETAPAPVPEKQKATALSKLSITGEIGYVALNPPNKDTLESGPAFGGTVAYSLLPYLDFRLPLLYSHHDGKTLANGIKNELSLLSFTPGFAFTTTGRLGMWFFLGAGPNFQSAKFQVISVSYTESSTAFSARFGAGADLKIWRTLSVGASGNVLTSSFKMMQVTGEKRWDTFTYYAFLGRIKYSF